MEAPAAAWGRNSSGQLGNGSNTDSNVPVQVSNLTGVTAISAGGSTTTGDGHSLALKDDGTVWVWGNNIAGQLGNGSSDPSSNVPVQVHDPTDPTGFLQNVTAISAGGSTNPGVGHSLALKNDGTVMAWGNNIAGQLGNGSSDPSSNVPVQVSGLSGVTAVAGGGLSQPGG